VRRALGSGVEFYDEVLDVRDGFGEEHGDVVVVEGVDDVAAAAVAGDEAEFA